MVFPKHGGTLRGPTAYGILALVVLISACFLGAINFNVSLNSRDRKRLTAPLRSKSALFTARPTREQLGMAPNWQLLLRTKPGA